MSPLDTFFGCATAFNTISFYKKCFFCKTTRKFCGYAKLRYVVETSCFSNRFYKDLVGQRIVHFYTPMIVRSGTNDRFLEHLGKGYVCGRIRSSFSAIRAAGRDPKFLSGNQVPFR